ncbi:apextrin-like protein 1 [Elysia marginata]|uniref:Apextrin-like protein 1 n=1 Tax=Elysia marginata TaxID=1093978 RepID=A0AAV4J068_9GAST|nr:apextrin-like protein 1 [Elysia marginata]
MAIYFKTLPILVGSLFLAVEIFPRHFVGTSTPVLPSYQLTCTPAKVVKGLTQNVRLRCERNPSVGSNLQEIERIRIMKLTQWGRWRTIAQITDYDSGVETDDDQMNATGLVGLSKAGVFLETTWPLAVQETFGVYKCDVVGLEKNFYHVEEVTAEVEIKEQNLTGIGVLNFITQMKNGIIAKVKANANRLRGIKKSRTQKAISILGKDYVSRDLLVTWPAGLYGLPQARSGCPVDLAFYGGDTGYVRFQVEPVIDEFHDKFHLAAPIMENTNKASFFSLHFCVVTRTFSSALWPDGSYCIHQKGGSCPQTFHITVSNMTGDFDLASYNSTYGGSLPDLGPTVLCCKDSGSPSNSIDLPTETPFYLYPYGNVCQQVRNMDVIPENIRVQPKGTHSPLSFDLCYYAKLKDSIND